MSIESFPPLPINQEGEKSLEKKREVFLSDKEVEAEIRILLGDLATIESLGVSGIGSQFEISGRLNHRLAGRFGIHGAIENGLGGLQVGDFTVDAGFLKKGIIQKTLDDALPKLVPSIRSYLEKKYGEPIRNLSIEHGALKIELTPEKIVTLEESSTPPILPEERAAEVEPEVPVGESVASKGAEVETPLTQEGSTHSEPPTVHVDSEPQTEFMSREEIPASLIDDLRASFLKVSSEPVVEEETVPVVAHTDEDVEGEKIEKINEAFLSHFNAQSETQGAQSRFTQRSIDEHRTRIEADETLSEKTKKELSNLVDELQEIKKGLNMKSFSPKEAAEKRRRANDILERLSTGAEKGVTREKINEVLAERAGAVEDKEGIAPETPPMSEAATLPHDVVTEGETSRVESGVRPPALERTPKETVGEWLMSGKVVKVERTGGGVEDGWRIARLYENGAALLSPDQSAIKKVPFEKLIAWQDLDVTPKEPEREGEVPQSAEPTLRGAAEAAAVPVAEEMQSTGKAVEVAGVQREIAALPEKTRMEVVRGWAGVAFTAQEMKNEGIGRALRFASGLLGSKENKQKKDSEKSTVRLLLDAFSRQYADMARVSATQRETFVTSGKGVGRFATNAILTTRAGLSLFGLANPIGNIATWGALFARRGIEAVKETRFAKRSETFRVQDEELAFEEAKRLEELVSAAIGKNRENITASDISRVYLREAPDSILERLKGSPEDTTANLTAKIGVIKMLEKITKDIVAQPNQKDTILKKHEKTLRDLDRIVGNGTTIDVVGSRLVKAGVWSNRIATVLAVESLAEGVHAIIERFGDHGEVAEAVEGVIPKTGGPVLSTQETIRHLGETRGLNLSNVEAPEDISEPVVIKHGGSVWSAAKEIGEKFGLSQKEVVEILKNSEQPLPDGRAVSLLELNLVHEGDSLSYVPGEHGELGHMEFHNGSEVPFGDAISLPGAEEVDGISHEDFEQAPWHEETPSAFLTEDAIAPEVATISSGDLSSAETIESSELQAPLPENLSLGERVSLEFAHDIRNLFGTVDSEHSEWQQWKGIPVKKFLSYRLEERTPAHSLMLYIKVLERESKLHPIGGLFRREEKIGDFVERALTAIVAKESQQ